MIPYPLLSFKELEHYANTLAPVLIQSRADRIFVPEAPAHPDHYFKKEWVMELATSQRSFQLYFSVRAQQCSLVLLPPKSLKPCTEATRSGFDLSLNKNLLGQKIIALTPLLYERAIKISFKEHDLLFIFIPNQPEAIFSHQGETIASTRLNSKFTLPPTRHFNEVDLKKIPFRLERIHPPETYAMHWLQARNEDAFFLRKQCLTRSLEHQLQQYEKKIASLTEQLEQNTQEPPWAYFGSLFQIHFYSHPSIQSDGQTYFYELLDFEKNETVKIPADPKLNFQAQLEKYFHLAKRNKTRAQESNSRIQALKEKENQVRRSLEALHAMSTLTELLAMEKQLGLSEKTFRHSLKEQKKITHFTGKTYQSEEGFTILAGKNLSENTELTFKIAKGNDLWMHVKGRPGSHTLILLPPGKTASLDTLLDAAHICILHSGGKAWGKTEVDYTFKKYVKKIKNQTEASYTQHKTLLIDLDPLRMKRLFSDGSMLK